MTEPFPVVAARVSLVAIPSVVLATGPRDATKDTVAATLLDARGSAARVVYPPDFAGDASVLFASVLARREACEPPGAMVGAIVEREIGVAIGNMGTHAQPAGGRVEIGYAIAPAYEPRLRERDARRVHATFTRRRRRRRDRRRDAFVEYGFDARARKERLSARGRTRGPRGPLRALVA